MSLFYSFSSARIKKLKVYVRAGLVSVLHFLHLLPLCFMQALLELLSAPEIQYARVDALSKRVTLSFTAIQIPIGEIKNYLS